MRAMILAAGRGLRMRPLTDHTPKPLLRVKDHPLIVHHIIALAKIGIQDIVINVGHLGHKIVEALGHGESFGVHIQYSYEDPILETGGGVAKALPLLGTEPFIVVSGDIFTDYPFQQLPKAPGKLLHIVLVDNPPHNPKGDFALNAGLVCEYGERLLNFAGIYVYRPEFFRGCPTGGFPINTLLKPAIQKQQVTGEYYQGVWHNIGTPEQLAQVHAA